MSIDVDLDEHVAVHRGRVRAFVDGIVIPAGCRLTGTHVDRSSTAGRAVRQSTRAHGDKA